MSVVQLDTGKAPEPINQEAIDILEGFIARVRSGEVRSVAVVAHRADGSSRYEWSLSNGGSLGAGILALSYAYGKALTEGGE